METYTGKDGEIVFKLNNGFELDVTPTGPVIRNSEGNPILDASLFTETGIVYGSNGQQVDLSGRVGIGKISPKLKRSLR